MKILVRLQNRYIIETSILGGITHIPNFIHEGQKCFQLSLRLRFQILYQIQFSNATLHFTDLHLSVPVL